MVDFEGGQNRKKHVKLRGGGSKKVQKGSVEVNSNPKMEKRNDFYSVFYKSAGGLRGI